MKGVYMKHTIRLSASLLATVGAVALLSLPAGAQDAAALSQAAQEAATAAHQAATAAQQAADAAKKALEAAETAKQATPERVNQLKETVQEAAGKALAGAYIGEDKAKAIAFAHAGITADQASRLRIKFDRDDRRPEYEVEFNVGRTEYEYDIDAVTGAIRSYERE